MEQKKELRALTQPCAYNVLTISFSLYLVSESGCMPSTSHTRGVEVRWPVLSWQLSFSDVITDCVHPLIHSGYFYSVYSSPLLLRGAPDTARIPKRQGNCMRVKDLPKVPTWRPERDSNSDERRRTYQWATTPHNDPWCSLLIKSLYPNLQDDNTFLLNNVKLTFVVSRCYTQKTRQGPANWPSVLNQSVPYNFLHIERSAFGAMTKSGRSIRGDSENWIHKSWLNANKTTGACRPTQKKIIWDFFISGLQWFWLQ